MANINELLCFIVIEGRVDRRFRHIPLAAPFPIVDVHNGGDYKWDAGSIAEGRSTNSAITTPSRLRTEWAGFARSTRKALVTPKTARPTRAAMFLLAGRQQISALRLPRFHSSAEFDYLREPQYGERSNCNFAHSSGHAVDGNRSRSLAR